MLFMLKSNVKEKIERFVENGGIFVATFASGVVDEYGLSFFDEACYPFRKLLGVKAEETDSLYDGQSNSVDMLGSSYRVSSYCELAYAEGAEVIGTYNEDFYAGMPAVTVNSYGKGKAYYVAADFDVEGYMDLYAKIVDGVVSADKIIPAPKNVSVTLRYGENGEYVFVMNFNNCENIVELPFEYDILSGEFEGGRIAPYGTAILKKRK
jgi:beta-galactosidase